MRAFSVRPSRNCCAKLPGLNAESGEKHVLLAGSGVVSTQRLALGDIGGGLIAALWPAELKQQAKYLYAEGRAEALIAAALSAGWTVKGSPHLGFWNSAPQLRLYLDPVDDVGDYVRRWAGVDGHRIGQYQPDEVRRTLWPWLLERGYATASDRGALDEFLLVIGRRGAHLKPALRLHCRWTVEDVSELSHRGELAVAIRRAVNAVLRAAGEPTLPARLQSA
jgi:hypothetical protein